jgi:hypothetical protein
MTAAEFTPERIAELFDVDLAHLQRLPPGPSTQQLADEEAKGLEVFARYLTKRIERRMVELSYERYGYNVYERR